MSYASKKQLFDPDISSEKIFNWRASTNKSKTSKPCRFLLNTFGFFGTWQFILQTQDVRSSWKKPEDSERVSFYKRTEKVIEMWHSLPQIQSEQFFSIFILRQPAYLIQQPEPSPTLPAGVSNFPFAKESCKNVEPGGWLRIFARAMRWVSLLSLLTFLRQSKQSLANPSTDRKRKVPKHERRVTHSVTRQPHQLSPLRPRKAKRHWWNLRGTRVNTSF
jgi:hypothetical protein